MNRPNHLWVLSNRALDTTCADERCLTEALSPGLSFTRFTPRRSLIGPHWEATVEASHLHSIHPALASLYTTYNNGKPWVFFLHGNHSHFSRVLTKCHALITLYDVNVLAFSWPSYLDGRWHLLKDYAAYLLNRELFYQVALARRTCYGIARERAAASWQALGLALEIFQSEITGPEKKVFLSHSMGNYLLQHWILHHPHTRPPASVFEPFDRLVLVQPDVDIEDHRLWLDRLHANERMVITQNRHDLLLHVADIIHQGGKDAWRQQGNRRLGSAVLPRSPGSPVYVDFSVMGRGPLAGHCLFDRLASRHESALRFFASILAIPDPEASAGAPPHRFPWPKKKTPLLES